MLPKPISEPQWTSTAVESRRERQRASQGSGGRGPAGRWLILLAVLTPVGLLTFLGLLVSQPAWLSQLTQRLSSLAAASSPSGMETSDKKPPTAALGQRVAADREMRYKVDGWAFLGQYSIKIYDPANGLNWRADFALDGETFCEDAEAFQRWADAHHCLLREQVAVALRSIPPDDLLDRQLDVLKRKLVTQVNRMVDDPFLKSVHLKGFRLYQSLDDSEFALWQEVNQDREDDPKEGEGGP